MCRARRNLLVFLSVTYDSECFYELLGVRKLLIFWKAGDNGMAQKSTRNTFTTFVLIADVIGTFARGGYSSFHVETFHCAVTPFGTLLSGSALKG